MSKHTPGPWKHDTLTEIGGQKTTCIYADTPDSPGGKTIIIRTGRVRGKSEVEAANIKLATAAPELLEALRETLAWMEDCLMDRGHPELPSRRAYNVVRNAVAKATGE